MSLEKTFDKTIRAASDLFMRSHVTGSGGNISFRDGDTIYITKSGTSFGHLRKDDFARVDIEGTILEGKPSKELPFFSRDIRPEENCLPFHQVYCLL